MRKITWILIFWSACSLSVYAQDPGQEEIPEITEETSFTSLHKSLVFPGWGQFSERRYVEGIIFSGAELFCLIEMFVNNHKGNQNYKLYKQAETVQDAVKFREMTEKFDTKRNQYLIAAAGVWILNLIDIYIIVKKREKKSQKPALNIMTGEGGLIKLSLSVKF